LDEIISSGASPNKKGISNALAADLHAYRNKGIGNS